MIRVEIINNFNSFLGLETAWNNMLSQSDVDVPFMSFEWFYCWLKSYGINKDILILLAKENDEILGIAPLMRTSIKFRGLPIRAITFIANEHSNRAGFILVKNKKEVVSSIFEYLMASKDRFDVLKLDFIEEDSVTDTMLSEIIKEKNLLYQKRKSNISPYVEILTSWDNYYNSRSSKFKKNLRHINNLFKHNNEFQIERYSNNGFKKGLEQVSTISKNTWKNKSKTAIVSSQNDFNFYSSLAELSSLKGWLDINILNFKNNPMAFEFNLIYKEKAYALKAGFDEKYRKLSPGVFLAMSVIKSCFDRGLKEYDQLGYNEKYKTYWSTGDRLHQEYCIFNNSFYGKVLNLLECRIISNIKRIKILRELVKYLRNIKMADKYPFLTEKIKRAYLSGGLIVLFRRICIKIGHFLFKFHSSYWFKKDLSKSFEEIMPKIKVNISYSSAEEIYEWWTNIQHGRYLYSEDFKEKRVAEDNNHLFVKIKKEDEIIGFLKVAFNKVYISDYQKILPLPENLAFIYDTFILNNYRGMGIAPYVINELTKELTKNNIKSAFCHIKPQNIASQRAYEKIGFKRIKLVLFLRIFGFKIFSFSPEKLIIDSSR